MSDNDIIKMNTNIRLTDGNGNPIPVVTPQPQILVETFSLNESVFNNVITGDKK